jgi:hypothetical protein
MTHFSEFDFEIGDEIIPPLCVNARHDPDVLSDLAVANGGNMVGLQYRLKSVESSSRKMADQPGIRINDALRCTMSFDEASFAEGTKTRWPIC